MSVEAPKSVEETPVVEPTKALPEQPEASTAPAETSAAAPAETTEAPSAATEEPAAAAPAEEPKKDEAETVPASEGVLGYKEPTFFKKFIYTKHYFWFQEEPSTADALTNFLRTEKADTKHSDAAWARETGKGLLFYSKRAEDKATPTGIINLTEASQVTKEGYNQFSFKAGAHQHRFEAATSKERDSWIAAVEKIVEETKSLKEELTGRDSYKKNLEEYSKPAFGSAPAAVKTARSKSKEPKKSVDAATAADAAAAAPAGEADEAAKSNNNTERSQSRKRGSLFGNLNLLGKKDEHAEKKEEKVEAKKEAKDEKKAEAADKKDEAKETSEPSTAVDAAEASAAAAVPAAVVAADKKEEKEDASPVEKKGKRGSVFGSLFKNRITSPTTEKSERDAMATSDVPPVSETAPKLEEPIENKPIDTAAVTAPVDTAATEEPAAAPKADKKGGLLGFIKKAEGKKEAKEEDKAGEAIAQDPVAAAAEPTEPAATSEPAAEGSAPATEERPARDNKRRTSLFFNKKAPEATETDDTVAEPKREKSPLPGGKFIGQLVRRASKAIKSEGAKEKTPAAPAAESTEPTADAPAAVPEPTETKAAEPATEATEPTTEPVAAAAPEVKATA